MLCYNKKQQKIIMYKHGRRKYIENIVKSTNSKNIPQSS